MMKGNPKLASRPHIVIQEKPASKHKLKENRCPIIYNCNRDEKFVVKNLAEESVAKNLAEKSVFKILQRNLSSKILQENLPV